jgi:hypothetical protein
VPGRRTVGDQGNVVTWCGCVYRGTSVSLVCEVSMWSSYSSGQDCEVLTRPSPPVVTNHVGCKVGVVFPGLVALGNDARDVVASDWSVDACATSVSRANTWRPTWGPRCTRKWCRQWFVEREGRQRACGCCRCKACVALTRDPSGQIAGSGL